MERFSLPLFSPSLQKTRFYLLSLFPRGRKKKLDVGEEGCAGWEEMPELSVSTRKCGSLTSLVSSSPASNSFQLVLHLLQFPVSFFIFFMEPSRLYRQVTLAQPPSLRSFFFFS